MRLPNFIVIGAPKSGTTSLFKYLDQHPEIYLPIRKELHYFSYENLKKNSNGPGDREILQRLCATSQEYENNYISVKDENAIGEISPSYLYYSHVSEKILSKLGRIKIIVILRNPIEKAYSQYIHLLSERRESLPFYDALMAERNRQKSGWFDFWLYAESTLYSDRIKRYITVFGKDKVKILLFDNLVSTPEEFMRDLFNFLAVDDSFCCDISRGFNKSRIPRVKIMSDLMKKPNSLKSMIKTVVPEKIRSPLRETLMNLNAIKKPAMDSKSREYLRKYFGADVKNLQELLGSLSRLFGTAVSCNKRELFIEFIYSLIIFYIRRSSDFVQWQINT
jgi:hypothetical protein